MVRAVLGRGTAHHDLGVERRQHARQQHAEGHAPACKKIHIAAICTEAYLYVTYVTYTEDFQPERVVTVALKIARRFLRL